jgi:hypothetical protein
MSDSIQLTDPEHMHAQSMVHRTASSLFHETSTHVRSAHGSLAAAWQGGGFDECSLFMQAFADHLMSFGDLHAQVGTNLDSGRAGYGQTESTAAKSLSN